jgi:hypothetical protein
MLKFAAERGVDRVLLVRVACAIARTALHIMPDGEDKPRLAIDAAERWCNEQTPENAAAAREAEWASADAAVALLRADPTSSAGQVGAAAQAVAAGAANTPEPAAWAKDSAMWASRYAARHAALADPSLASRHAEIVREMIPWAMIAAVQV